MLPKLLDYQISPAQITLQRIQGHPYLDLADGFSPNTLAQTLAAFHLATLNKGKCLCHIDNQPRNVLEAKDQIYLIDFSDSLVDFPERDITHLLLFWAADLPQDKFNLLTASFMEEYSQIVPLSHQLWQHYLGQSIGIFDSRRKLYNKSGKNPPEIQTANRNRLAKSLIF